MPYQTIAVRKLTPHIGAEIDGVDLARPLGNRQFQEVHDALMEHLVVFFRDQRLTHDEHKAFGRLFGELHIHPSSTHSPDGHPEILTIHADENSKHVAGEEWHSDVSCDVEPPMGSILYLTEVPPEGGDTLFASMYAAYDRLSPAIRRLVEGLTAIHDGEPVYRGRFGHPDARGKEFPRAAHPVVRTHPVTGRKALFVNPNFTTRIAGLSRLESDALLQLLYRHCETPEFHCRFRWQPGSVAFWDNRSAQHHAMWDYFPQRRHGYRVTIRGDRPFYRA
jgi:alpha-ketoglutarate-dependent taurine dioxygenase